MNEDNVNLGGEGMLVARKVSSASLAFGLLLAALGIFSVLTPLFTGMAVTSMITVLLLLSGIAQGFFAFQSASLGKGAIRFLIGGLSVAAAIAIMVSPGEGLGVLTAVLAVYFLSSGIGDIFFSSKIAAGEGKGWMLLNGIVSISLAGLIISNWPVSGVWAVGLYVGVRFMLYGMMLMVLGNTGKQALTHIQDTRIAVLEQHLRDGAQALQQTQAVLADHAAMLLALDNEVRKKVSSSEIDPSIVALNKDLSKAREGMSKVSTAASENWAKTQDEANAAFKKLQESTSEISKKLKKDLGLDQ